MNVIEPGIINLRRPNLLLEPKVLQPFLAFTLPSPVPVSSMMMTRTDLLLLFLAQTVIASLRRLEVHFRLDHRMLLWLPDWLVNPSQAFVGVHSLGLGVGAALEADDPAGFLGCGVVFWWWVNFVVMGGFLECRWGHLDQDAVLEYAARYLAAG